MAPDGHRSTYSRAWLRANAYALGREAPPPPTSDLSRIVLLGRGRDLTAQVQESLHRVQLPGAAVVRHDLTTPPRPRTRPNH